MKNNMKNTRLKTISESVKRRKISEAKSDARFDIIITPINCDIDSGDMMYVEKGGSGSLAKSYNEGEYYTKKEVEKELNMLEHGDPNEDNYNWLAASVLDVKGKKAKIKLEVVEMKSVSNKTIEITPEER